MNKKNQENRPLARNRIKTDYRSYNINSRFFKKLDQNKKMPNPTPHIENTKVDGGDRANPVKLYSCNIL